MPKETSRKEGSKRDKYTSQACFECQRRKVKCSGEPICSSCRTRSIECCYAGENAGESQREVPTVPTEKKRTREEYTEMPSKPCPRKKSKPSTSLKEQLSQLQDQVNALSRVRRFSGADAQAVTAPYSYNMSISDRDQSPKRRSRSISTVSNDQAFGNHSVGSLASSNDISSPFKDPTETYTLGVSTPSVNSLPIGSQLSALRRLRQCSAAGDLDDSSQSTLATVKLPESQVLWELVNVFFQEFESYFPCLNQAVIYERLSTVLFSYGYDQGTHQIVIGREHCKIIAILLNMLAYAEAITRPIETWKPRQFPPSYLQGFKLMQHFNQLHDGDLETIIYHTTASAFLLEMSEHHMALQSTTQGFQIALKIGLNNQALWPDVDSELVSRQGLWWTLYFLDKRITQKCGMTYFLREDESAVNDFSKLKSNMGLSKYELLQSLITFSRLWARIWDGFFSPQAPKADDWEELQMMDTRIVISYRQIPSTLHWNSSMATKYMCVEGQTHIRQRLIVFLRFQSLRLAIRHRALTSTDHDAERRKTSIAICEAIIEGIRSYMITTTSLKPCGYILTTALVECLYHVLPEECLSPSIISSESLKGIVFTATQLLRTLSKSTAMASKVYHYLRDVLPSDDGFGPPDRFAPFSPSPNIADPQILQDCLVSERFWRSIMDCPEQDSASVPTNAGSGNMKFIPDGMELPEESMADYLPFKLDDIPGQFLMDLDLGGVSFKDPLSLDYATTPLGGDLL